MALSTWVYASVSTLVPALAERELQRIVDVSRRRNALAGVTGALLFTGVRFAQCIEGPTGAVEEIRASIVRDTRHKAVITVMQCEIAGRAFGDWALAYVGPSPTVGRTINKSVREVHDGQAGGGEHLHTLLIRLAEEASVQSRSAKTS